MKAQEHLPFLNGHYELVVSMLCEIEDFQKELESMNDSLLEYENNASSQYGGFILEQMQSKLFYLQRLLRGSTFKLEKHKNLLKDVIDGKVVKSETELNEYIVYCQETAKCVQDKLAKFKKETRTTIEAYGW